MPVPGDGTALLLCLPYSGVGATSYRRWPKTVGGMTVCALQPPGRENRLREPRPATHREFAASLADFVRELGDRPYAFFGHCGAVPYALETTRYLAEHGDPLPLWILASSWGAPDNGLYGRLNFVDLDGHDFVAEIVSMAGQMGSTLLPEMASLGAEILRHDQVVQRPYRYPPGHLIEVPVTVIGWTHDEVVPPGEVFPGWERVAGRLERHTLPGSHFEFLRCPEELQELIAGMPVSTARPGRSAV
ncbi:thioesterase domain-containing protein [Sphaerisporangium sp. TRM90804]|uniref:thioesterase II family protein n=1 Tax=Sphaerisporangium sp. TRM90804 TaxID=3031113 RepID=UPI00244962A4|nr:thioesterase domain-containing protein [Sphaerisporangium sp. TRM90804]MDH2427096.1 thioesterase domain-containing protein [Sphaerisporangium sp. TRM90804]